MYDLGICNCHVCFVCMLYVCMYVCMYACMHVCMIYVYDLEVSCMFCMHVVCMYVCMYAWSMCMNCHVCVVCMFAACMFASLLKDITQKIASVDKIIYAWRGIQWNDDSKIAKCFLLCVCWVRGCLRTWFLRKFNFFWYLCDRELQVSIAQFVKGHWLTLLPQRLQRIVQSASQRQLLDECLHLPFQNLSAKEFDEIVVTHLPWRCIHGAGNKTFPIARIICTSVCRKVKACYLVL